MYSSDQIENLLKAMNEGDLKARDALFKLVYQELGHIARANLRNWRAAHPTIDTRALVHETFLKLTSGKSPDWQGRAHFYNAVAKAMRQIILNYVRDKQAGKRNGVNESVWELDEQLELMVADAPERIEALNEALKLLEKTDKRCFDVVNYRFFLGLDIGETAELLGINPRTVNRDWSFSRAWLEARIEEILSPTS
ncbi:MAG: sigma-70 family RNA polymerase sigma factor [Bacteroidetes Order II. Incertae sedis bacterium]|nr:sigma-70 family RNA polymerase sigma factor [Bacteroidetes Order II. bacterium]